MARLFIFTAAVLLSGTGVLQAHHGPPHTEVDEFLEPAKKESAFSGPGAILIASLIVPAAALAMYAAQSRREKRVNLTV